MTFGERLKQARENKGLTQENLALLIGVAKSTITGYEKDNREPDVMKIKLLSQALNVTGDYLIGNSPEEFSVQEQSLIKKYRSLSREGQETVSNLIDSLCKMTLSPAVVTRQQPKATQNDKPDIEAAKKRLAEIKYREDHAARIAAKGGNSTFPTTVYPTPEDIEKAKSILAKDTSNKKE